MLTYALLRRAETLLTALGAVLTLRPVLLLLVGVVPLTDDRSARRRPGWPARHGADVWNGAGPRTVRGPPAVDLAC